MTSILGYPCNRELAALALSNAHMHAITMDVLQ
jgi:hypothetical protein